MPPSGYCRRSLELSKTIYYFIFHEIRKCFWKIRQIRDFFFLIFGKIRERERFFINEFCTSYQKFSSIGSKLSEKAENKQFKTIFQEKNHSATVQPSHKNQCMVIHDFRALKIPLGPHKKIKKKIVLNIF